MWFDSFFENFIGIFIYFGFSKFFFDFMKKTEKKPLLRKVHENSKKISQKFSKTVQVKS